MSELELSRIPAPLEPLQESVSPKNLAIQDNEILERIARMKARLTRWQRWVLSRRVLKLWKQLNRSRYNELVSERHNLLQKFERLKQDYQTAKEDGAPSELLELIADSARATAAAGKAADRRLILLEPMHAEYTSIRDRLTAHQSALAREREDEENRAAFFQEKLVYEQLIKAALRKMPECHYSGKDSKGRDIIRIPEIERVFVAEDRMYFKVRVASQSMFQRLLGNKWTSCLPYGVLPKHLTSEQTLEALSAATDRSVTVERGKVGQELFWVVNRLDSPDGIPEKVSFSKVIQYYPADQHKFSPWPLGVTRNRRTEWLTLEDLSNILIAGAAGGGKSNELNAIIATLISMNTPQELRLLLIDNKGGIEFTHWSGIPHLIGEMIKDESQVLEALEKVTALIRRRLAMFERLKAKKLSAFNLKVKDEDRLPRLIVVIDEMSTLTGLDDSAEIQHALKVITAQGRAVGVHVIVCTQHVSVNIVEGAIKTNMQVRASTKMPSEVSSRIILDTMSAATLPNIPGRMVFSLGRNEIIAQAPLITDGEIVEAVRIAQQYPSPDNREFTGVTVKAREKFSREDLIAIAVENFSGKLSAESIHSTLGNEVITLRNLKTMIKGIAESGTVHYEGNVYKIGKLGKGAVLRPMEQAIDHKFPRIQ